MIRSFLNATVFENNTINSIFKLEITLDKEIALLQSYIEFEKLQKDNFDYKINEIESGDSSNYKIQPMLIQPFVENAIKHGFNESAIRGKLLITFSEKDDGLLCIIDDNGIGRKRTKEIQQRATAKYKSLGSDLVFTRVEVLKRVGYAINIDIIDKPNDAGTIVEILIKFEGK